MNRVSQEQIEDWVADSVTEALWWLCSRELADEEEIELIDLLVGGNPQKTQEKLLVSATRRQEWEKFLNLLKGKFKEELGDLKTYDSLVKDDEDEESE